MKSNLILNIPLLIRQMRGVGSWEDLGMRIGASGDKELDKYMEIGHKGS